MTTKSRFLPWLLLACLALLGACHPAAPEARLRGTIEGMQHALEQGRPRDFMAAVAPDFAGNGGMDRAALHNLLRAQLLAHARVGATLGPLQVRIDGTTATVESRVLLTGGGERGLPDSAGAYRLTTGWREVDGDWQVYYARWEPW